jgi:hypothetical protein
MILAYFIVVLGGVMPGCSAGNVWWIIAAKSFLLFLVSTSGLDA